MSTFSQHSRRSGKGFTLIELLVVGAIIIIITTLFLLRQSKFDSSTILRSLAYSIALSMRQAQVYGVSVQGSSQGSSVTYASGYGLYFSAASPVSYILFADFNNNGQYNSGEDIKAFSLNNGYRISEICALNSLKNCSGQDDSTGAKTIDTLSVVFRRPNPDACISTTALPPLPSPGSGSGVCGPGATQTFASAYIQINTQNGTTRSVTVSNTGAITTQGPGTPP